MTIRALILALLLVSPALAQESVVPPPGFNPQTRQDWLDVGYLFAPGDRVALVNDKGEIVRYATNISPDNGTEDGWKWLPAPDVKPAYDAPTQVLEGPVVSVTETAVITAYTVRDKTAEELAAELDSEKEQTLDGVGELVLRRLCDHESRLRVLEGKTAITWEQCRKAIKDALTP